MYFLSVYLFSLLVISRFSCHFLVDIFLLFSFVLFFNNCILTLYVDKPASFIGLFHFSSETLSSVAITGIIVSCVMVLAILGGLLAYR